MENENSKCKPYFESHAETAAYLGMSLDEFLRARSSGKFPVKARPKDATLVYFVEDLLLWESRGRPCSLAGDHDYPS